MFLLLLLAVANAAEMSLSNIQCSDTTYLIEGHLHLTSVKKTFQQQSCLVPLFQLSTFLEFERYSGRENDEAAWTNFTFIGEPNVTLSIKNNEMCVSGDCINIPAYSKLEKSLWIHVSFQHSLIELHSAPVGTRNFGHIATTKHKPTYTAELIATTSSGMEQVIRNVVTDMPGEDTDVAFKTIFELERRIDNMESDINTLKTSTGKKIQNMRKLIDKLGTVKQSSLTIPISILLVIILVVAWMKRRPKRNFRLD